MDFWETLWATMWGALAGAFVAAFAAWLFSLDLRRREREDRAQEREQAKSDRQAEREEDRLSREAGRLEDSAARAAERESDHADRVRQEWPRVIQVLGEYANSDRAIFDATRTGGRIGNQAMDANRKSTANIHQCLFEVATVAKGLDHDIVSLIGQLLTTGIPHTEQHLRSIDQANAALVIYTTASPHSIEAAQFRLVALLRDSLNEARVASGRIVVE
jgi:hypothetical protein